MPGAVHLGGVLSGEGAASVPGYAAVGVHQYLASREARITLGPSYGEPAAGVDEVVGTGVSELLGYHLVYHQLGDITGRTSGYTSGSCWALTTTVSTLLGTP